MVKIDKNFKKELLPATKLDIRKCKRVLERMIYKIRDETYTMPQTRETRDLRDEIDEAREILDGVLYDVAYEVKVDVLACVALKCLRIKQAMHNEWPYIDPNISLVEVFTGCLESNNTQVEQLSSAADA